MRKLVSDAQNERKIADSMFAKLAKHCVRELETCFFSHFANLACTCNAFVLATYMCLKHVQCCVAQHMHNFWFVQQV